MEKSTVYFTDFRCPVGTSQLDKLKKLCVTDLCKEQGGMPFLTDCNTLYPGSRKNALEHLECANLN